MRKDYSAPIENMNTAEAVDYSALVETDIGEEVACYFGTEKRSGTVISYRNKKIEVQFADGSTHFVFFKRVKFTNKGGDDK